MGKGPLLTANDEYRIKLQALGGVQGHERKISRLIIKLILI